MGFGAWKASGKKATSMSMSRNSISSRDRLKRYIASAHPYAFDGLFDDGTRWTGSGRVKLCDRGGGVNQAWALIEADHAGYLALKSAGFRLQQPRKKPVLPQPVALAAKKKAATKY